MPGIYPGDNPTLAAARRDLHLLAHVLDVPAKLGNAKCPFHRDAHASLSVFMRPSGEYAFRCHACGAAGTVVDALALQTGASAGDAIRELSKHEATIPPRRTRPERARDLDAEGRIATEARDDLNADGDALTYLWERRGIGVATALAFGLGVRDIRRDAGGRIESATWTMPVLDASGYLIGVKLHRDPPGPGQPKAGWLVKGGQALYPRPEAFMLSPGAEIVVAEGELKALAYADAGLAATSPTCGGAAGWPAELCERFRGLKVIVDADRDGSEASSRFVQAVAGGLRDIAASVEVTEGGADCEAGI